MRRLPALLLALTFAISACSLTQPDGRRLAHGGPTDRAWQAQAAFHQSISGALPCYALIGRVVDDNSFAPLPGLSVLIGDSTTVNQTRTGIDGNFRFDSLSGSADWIELRSLDGRTARTALNFIASDSTKRVRMVDPTGSNLMFVQSPVARSQVAPQVGGVIFSNSAARVCDLSP